MWGTMERITERLILREFKESDWPDVLAYQSDPRYLRYYEWTKRTPEAVQAFVRGFLDQRQEQLRTRASCPCPALFACLRT